MRNPENLIAVWSGARRSKQYVLRRLPDSTPTASATDSRGAPVVAGRAVASDATPVKRAEPADHFVTSSSRVRR